MMNPTEINLPRKLLNQLLHQAQLTPELETCGLIGINTNGLTYSCYPIPNRDSNPQHRYLLDSQAQINAMQTMRDKQETLFAIYHSHPQTPAIPSQTDLEFASYPTAIQLIISLNTKGVLELRAYKFNEKTAIELTLNLIEV